MSRTKKILWGAAAAVLLVPLVASGPWCPQVTAAPPQLMLLSASQEPLRAGAAKVAIDVPLPIVVAGYGPSRSTATTSNTPLYARALVVRSGETSFGLVVLDVLLIPGELADAVRAQSALTETWVAATHTHSSFGGFDRRWAAQAAGTGRYQDAARDAMLKAALAALKEAGATLRPCTVSAGTTAPTDLTVPRSGASADTRLTRVDLRAPDGPIAELLIASAHPALVGRDTTQLDPDWPGAFSAQREAAGTGLSLVVQGAAANASVALRENETIAAYAQRVAIQTALVPVRGAGDRGLYLTRVGVTLPEVDSARLVPTLLVRATNNLLCEKNDAVAAVSLVRLGALNLLAMPAELSLTAGRSMEATGGADRVITLTGGYVGYVEPSEVVERVEGEAKRQYYGPALAQTLEAGARTAFEALSLTVLAPKPP